MRRGHNEKGVPGPVSYHLKILTGVSPRPAMWEFLQSPKARIVEWTTLLVLLIVAMFYIVAKVRDGLKDDDNDANELLTKFREMHAQGDLSDDEFRTIKTRLAQRSQKQ